jgi:membrane protease YdiL (CAAX protease family)
LSTVTAFVKRHPLIAFFVLAYALTWPLIPFVSVSPLWGFPAVFGPALAAIIVVAVADGRAGLQDLLGRMARWRVGARWYVVALGLPAVLALAAAGLHTVLGAQTPVEFGGLSVLNFVVFVLNVGEELGWRGYALPKLLAERSVLAASLSLGAVGGHGTCRRSSCRGRPSTGCPSPRSCS